MRIGRAASPDPDREVYRPAPAVVLWWLWAAFAVANLIDIGVQGHGRTAAVVATVIVLITGVMYACALRPRVVADSAGITIVNPLRDHRIPWSAVSAVDVGETLQVHCQRPGGGKEKVLHSWAVQRSRRGQAKAELRARRSAMRAQRQPSYARLPPQARELLNKSQAELTAEALAGRAAAVRAAGEPGQPGAWTAHWAGGPIAAVALPAIALVIVILA